MLDKDNTLEYNHKIFSQERKKQKISQENAATLLTLSVAQINSLENNFNSGFVNLHFKTLALKRYAKLLTIDFNKVILPKVTEEENLNYITKEDLLLDELPKQNLKISKKNTYIGLIILILVLLLIYFFTQPDPFNYENNHNQLADPIVISSEVSSLRDSVEILPPVSESFNKNKSITTKSKPNIQEVSNTSNIAPIEFLCSIKSASMDKIWARKDPEKPANYFHIVSQKKQSICTLDNQGQFKQYDLGEGGKLTHRGEAPFKVQLDPSISELYFQGWKVILNEGDNFIQLNPVDIAIGLN